MTSKERWQWFILIVEAVSLADQNWGGFFGAMMADGIVTIGFAFWEGLTTKQEAGASR
jgi:hypothetical protein